MTRYLLALVVLTVSTSAFARNYIECGKVAAVSPQCSYQCDDEFYVKVSFEPAMIQPAAKPYFAVFANEEMSYYEGPMQGSLQGGFQVYFGDSKWARSFRYDPASQTGMVTLKVWDRQADRWSGKLQTVELPCKPSSF